MLIVNGKGVTISDQWNGMYQLYSFLYDGRETMYATPDFMTSVWPDILGRYR